MVSMQAHFSTGGTFPTFDSHFERPLAAYAELKFTLGASEMHASPLGESVAEFAVWTLYTMLLEVFFHSFGLVVGVIGFFPGGKVFTGQALVCGLPLRKIQILISNELIMNLVGMSLPVKDTWHKTWLYSLDRPISCSSDQR